jgi:hypothetical protein
VVMRAINRAKRRFFLRPRYLGRHLADIARLAWSKPSIVGHLASRILFGQNVVDATPHDLATAHPSDVHGTGVRRAEL